ncbi:fimbrial biogenesis outer membrane usher protein [Leclercia adecarboxylata]|uniref:fimbria/pilus outer membrane usher protein n=1 Tax=Leclercia adecarboxylata TaxID=83655 RepID=UPI002DBE7242|nr:fimbria/pilus outer membrane usher protein [Leclercia adecarboxylata]MEB6377366.1 fimbrial biogenesis outer membrane usher protein [Leclercia adecarboxylata]
MGNSGYKITLLAGFITLALTEGANKIYAREYFNPELIELDNPGIDRADLIGFETGSQAAGVYHVDIILDGQLTETRDVAFANVTDSQGESRLEPCLSVDALTQWGVKTERFPGLSQPGSPCARLDAIPQASTDFQFASQRLVISVPQAALTIQARGYVQPAQWDDGITAAMLNYSLSGARILNRNGGSDNTQYANLRPGFNIGPWRLRNYATWSRDGEGQTRWDHVYTWLQRGIVPLSAQLTLGESSSPADVFDSMPFRGMQLASDDDMLPDSLRGYAPVVRGIARSNAQVIIRQNGYQIYQNYVAPGTFEISDMYPTGGAGDLDVTIKEADGSVQHFTVPFASLPVLQREGQLKYAVTAGQYRPWDHGVDKTPFSQLTGIYGLPYGLTLYGGFEGASKYQSLALGMGKNMGDFGAFSADVTQAWSTPKEEHASQGQSWRTRYSKNFVKSGTNVAIAGYRYSTRGYYGMQEVLDAYGSDSAFNDRRRNRAELTMNQTLGNTLGSLMLSAVAEDYWNVDQTKTSWSLGYNAFWRSVSYGLTYTWSGSDSRYAKEQMASFNISVPLAAFLPQTWVNYAVTVSKNRGATHSMGMNGTALDNNALSWNVQQGYGADNRDYTGNINGDYKGTYGEATAGYSYDQYSDRLNYALQGGVVLHADGVTFAQPLGETSVLIQAPGAAGVGVQNQSGARTDYRGYALSSNLTPYRKNDISLLTDTLPVNVELAQTVQTVTPTRGALVRASYVASVGLRILMTLTRQNGQPVPFGAVATENGTQNAGFIVGESGQVYLTGLQQDVKLTVKWGESEQQRCQAHYALNNKQPAGDIIRADVVCH